MKASLEAQLSELTEAKTKTLNEISEAKDKEIAELTTKNKALTSELDGLKA
ncbi:MAG: hypothetical protein V2I33_19095 [Kangiellaceae bacterium]|jgi:hypothetical protein|nr:hypothetical protein [Kangiellaceae bacterium]